MKSYIILSIFSSFLVLGCVNTASNMDNSKTNILGCEFPRNIDSFVLFETWDATVDINRTAIHLDYGLPNAGTSFGVPRVDINLVVIRGDESKKYRLSHENESCFIGPFKGSCLTSTDFPTDGFPTTGHSRFDGFDSDRFITVVYFFMADEAPQNGTEFLEPYVNLLADCKPSY